MSPNGYGRVTKILHWLTFVALCAQFVIGYLLDVDSRGRGRGRGRGSGPGRGRGRGGETDLSELLGDNELLTGHVVLGLSILTLAVIRVWWRRRAGLPPWAEGLSQFERTLAHRTEVALYALLFIIPTTGLWLVFVSDDAVALHVASHVAFYLAFGLHVGLVLKHQLVNRDRLLRRML